MSKIEKRKKHSFLYRKNQQLLITALLVVLIVISSMMDTAFLSLENFENLMTTSLPFIFVAFAQMIVIVTKGIDLSVGSVISLANVICAVLMTNEPLGFVFGLIVALAAGATAGFINGVIVAKGKLQPIIVTLASSSFYLGIALWILPIPGGKVHTAFARAMDGDVAGIPVALIIGIIVTISMFLLVFRMKYGNFILAIGGNENAAFSTGIQINKVKIATYTLTGLLSAMAGVLLATQMYSGDPTVGTSFTMKSITVAVIGGTSLAGGKATVFGILSGVFILVIINNILNLVGLNSFYQYVFQGSILIFALAISSFQLRKNGK
jgi:ribose transport system permease protein